MRQLKLVLTEMMLKDAVKSFNIKNKFETWNQFYILNKYEE